MNKKYRPVKLEDLAKKLNVSNVTVSKALRDHPDISVETKQRVKELAEKLGYMPNLIARNLSSRRSNTIGLVVPKVAHIFFSTVIEAVYDAAFENNYEIVLTISQEQAEREKRHIQTLLSMKVDGLIVSVTQETTDLEIFKHVMKLNIPIVFIDRVPDLPGTSSISVDDLGGAYTAIEYAIKKGYRKIGLLGGYQHINIGKARYQGFEQAMNNCGVPINPKWVHFGGFGEEDGYYGFKKIIETGDIPEYVLAVTYPVALGMYSAAAELGISIPQDIEVTCFGKNTFNRFIPSVFNFIDQPAHDLGTEAVKLMLEHINDPQAITPKQIQLSTNLMIEESVNQKYLAI